VSSQIVVQKDELVIRRMLDSPGDYELLARWRNSPHVRNWWDPDEPPMTVASATEEYRPDTAPTALTTLCIVELRGVPVGFMQFYRWSSYGAEADEVGIPYDDASWGVDLFIGERDALGQGLGTRMMELLSDYLETERDASSIVLTTEVDNATAIRCYEKAGFIRGARVLDTDTRDGERVWTWVMTRNKTPIAPRPT
jgi:aminoglycoside 6'-N-acetyltransferase